MAVPKFLIVDDDADSRALLRWTFRRTYPQTVTREAVTLQGAVDHVLAERPDVVIVHRAADGDAVAIIRAIRAVAPRVAIVALSGSEVNAKAALEEGANEFLRRDEWLRLRSVLDGMLAARNPPVIEASEESAEPA